MAGETEFPGVLGVVAEAVNAGAQYGIDTPDEVKAVLDDVAHRLIADLPLYGDASDMRLVRSLSIAMLCAELEARLMEATRGGDGAWRSGNAGAAPGRDFELALTALEDVQMRATRGLAKQLGQFAPADLESGQVAESFVVVIRDESADFPRAAVVRTVRAPDAATAEEGARALWGDDARVVGLEADVGPVEAADAPAGGPGLEEGTPAYGRAIDTLEAAERLAADEADEALDHEPKSLVQEVVDAAHEDERAVTMDAGEPESWQPGDPGPDTSSPGESVVDAGVAHISQHRSTGAATPPDEDGGKTEEGDDA